MASKNYTAGELINIFRLQNDKQPQGRMSDEEVLDLLNRTLIRVYTHTHWAFLVKAGETAAINGELTLPTDLFKIIPSTRMVKKNMNTTVVEVDEKFYLYNTTADRYAQPVKRSHRFGVQGNQSNDKFYFDMLNNKLVFVGSQTNDTFQYDYMYLPDYVGIDDTTILPIGLQPCVPHLMNLEFVIIENESPDESFDDKNLKTFYEYLNPFVQANNGLMQYVS